MLGKKAVTEEEKRRIRAIVDAAMTVLDPKNNNEWD
jgi:hypothetical protein